MEFYTITLPDVEPMEQITAASSFGVGFVTSFVSFFCNLFGSCNRMYIDKMERSIDCAMERLEQLSRICHADGVMDIRFQFNGLSVLVSGTPYKHAKKKNAGLPNHPNTAFSKPAPPSQDGKLPAWKRVELGLE